MLQREKLKQNMFKEQNLKENKEMLSKKKKQRDKIKKEKMLKEKIQKERMWTQRIRKKKLLQKISKHIIHRATMRNLVKLMTIRLPLLKRPKKTKKKITLKQILLDNQLLSKNTKSIKPNPTKNIILKNKNIKKWRVRMMSQNMKVLKSPMMKLHRLNQPTLLLTMVLSLIQHIIKKRQKNINVDRKAHSKIDNNPNPLRINRLIDWKTSMFHTNPNKIKVISLFINHQNATLSTLEKSVLLYIQNVTIKDKAWKSAKDIQSHRSQTRISLITLLSEV